MTRACILECTIDKLCPYHYGIFGTIKQLVKSFVFDYRGNQILCPLKHLVRKRGHERRARKKRPRVTNAENASARRRETCPRQRSKMRPASVVRCAPPSDRSRRSSTNSQSRRAARGPRSHSNQSLKCGRAVIEQYDVINNTEIPYG